MDAEKCKHCGWQETEHIYGTQPNGEYNDLPTSDGLCSLNDCPEFCPETNLFNGV